MWRVRMDGGMDAFSFGGGDCTEEITDALDESIEVRDSILSSSSSAVFNACDSYVRMFHRLLIADLQCYTQFKGVIIQIQHRIHFSPFTNP